MLLSLTHTSRHNGCPTEDPLKPLETIVMWYFRGFRGPSIWPQGYWVTPVSRTAARLINVVNPVWNNQSINIILINNILFQIIIEIIYNDVYHEWARPNDFFPFRFFNPSKDVKILNVTCIYIYIYIHLYIRMFMYLILFLHTRVGILKANYGHPT